MAEQQCPFSESIPNTKFIKHIWVWFMENDLTKPWEAEWTNSHICTAEIVLVIGRTCRQPKAARAFFIHYPGSDFSFGKDTFTRWRSIIPISGFWKRMMILRLHRSAMQNWKNV